MKPLKSSQMSALPSPFDTQYQEFLYQVALKYHAKRRDVEEMFVLEMNNNMDHAVLTDGKSVSLVDLFQTTIMNCEAWVKEERTSISPEDLVFYRLPPLYFRAIKPKNDISKEDILACLKITKR